MVTERSVARVSSKARPGECESGSEQEGQGSVVVLYFGLSLELQSS